MSEGKPYLTPPSSAFIAVRIVVPILCFITYSRKFFRADAGNSGVSCALTVSMRIFFATRFGHVGDENSPRSTKDLRGGDFVFLASRSLVREFTPYQLSVAMILRAMVENPKTKKFEAKFTFYCFIPVPVTVAFPYRSQSTEYLIILRSETPKPPNHYIIANLFLRLFQKSRPHFLPIDWLLSGRRVNAPRIFKIRQRNAYAFSPWRWRHFSKIDLLGRSPPRPPRTDGKPVYKFSSLGCYG